MRRSGGNECLHSHLHVGGWMIAAHELVPAVGTEVLLGNLIVLLPMLLNAHAVRVRNCLPGFCAALLRCFVARMSRRCFALWWHAAGSAFSRGSADKPFIRLLRIGGPERGISPAHIGCAFFYFLGINMFRGVEWLETINCLGVLALPSG